jgi:5-methyltetrahydrofolate--homocysteine methyltransferase
MESLLTRLRSGEVLVADGAMGTLLFERGLERGNPPEGLNLTRPEVLEEVARLYFDAGAQIVQTNTFGGSPLKLAMYNLDGQTEEINARAAQAVRRAVGDKAYVSGSCGPTGRILKPYGDTEPEDVRAAFERQMKALLEAGVDLLCVETMTDLTEARMAVEAARSLSKEIPLVATMTFDPTPRGFFTVMGTDIPTAARELAAAGVDILGSNCGNGIEQMIRIALEFKEHSTLPVIIQSNAGIPVHEDGETVYPEGPEFMAEKARELLAGGVAIIGGCCGTTPDHIRALRKAVAAANGPASR